MDTKTVEGLPGFGYPAYAAPSDWVPAQQAAPVGFAIGQGPYGQYAHGLSTQTANRYKQPYNGFPFAGTGGPAAYPGSFPGHPGMPTGLPYPYAQPLPSAGGSYGSYGKEYGAGGWPHPTEHHGYRPNGRGHWGFAAPQY